MRVHPKALAAAVLTLCFAVLIVATAITPVAAVAGPSEPLFLPFVRVAGMPARPVIYINEFMADNDNIVADEHGEYDDVIELYNPGPVPVNLGGMHLTDDLTDPVKFRIEEGVAVPARGYLLFWADSSPEQGLLHVNFSLSKGGESIGLFDTDDNGNALLDSYTFGPQMTDVSEGRCPNGGSAWVFFQTPTMGATNEPCSSPPKITGVHHQPAFPPANRPVTVTASITATGAALTATLWYSAEVDFVAVPMAYLGNDAYQAAIPGQSEDVWVRYYVEAEDSAGRKRTDPPGAPAAAHGYVAGFSPPDLALNEIMADNVSTLQDPDEPSGQKAQYPDWIELHNYGSQPLDLGGYSLTDDPTEPAQYVIPQGVVIPAGGFLVFYADDEPEQGPLHTNFKLSAGGETLGLYAAEGRIKLDEVAYPAPEPDVAYGRSQDGVGAWGVRPKPTPGMSNVLNLSKVTDLNVWLPLTNVIAQPPSLPLRINVGANVAYTAVNGTVFLPDRAYGAGSYYGYLGGYEDKPLLWNQQFPISHTKDQALYKTQRLDWREYHVAAIPNGDYLLTLRFAEQIAHAAGLSVFDLMIEGETVADHFDVFALTGRADALDRRFAVKISDGELTIAAVPVAGKSHLAALELVQRARDTAAPSVPAGLSATPSYGAVLLDWADSPEDDVAGYHIYRASAAGALYTRLTTNEPVYASHFQVNLGNTLTPYHYRVSAVDVYGNESAQGASVSAAAISAADAVLPLYKLTIAPAALQSLARKPYLDDKVPAKFTWRGNTLDVKVRFRGSSSRAFDKKSWKIVFREEDSPFPNHDRINVNANWMDGSLFRSKLATDLFSEAGLHPPQAELVLLIVNDDYRGVYTRNEQVDEGFLLRSGRNPGASIYKVSGRFLELLPNEAAYRTYYEKKTNDSLGFNDLIQFIELVNRIPDDQFATRIAQVMDVESFLSYYAIIVLIADFDSSWHNIYMVHDLDTDRWELLPWDMDMAFRDINASIDLGTLERADEGGGNILRSRMLAVPAFRADFCRLLKEYMDTIFSDAAMHARADALYRSIRQDARRDWHKLSRENNAAFEADYGYINNFITERKAYLRGEMQSFCPQP